MSRFALLNDLPNRTSSEARRELLREVTGSLSGRMAGEDAAELDKILASVAADFSVEVRTEFAKLVAASTSRFCHSADFASEMSIEFGYRSRAAPCK